MKKTSTKPQKNIVFKFFNDRVGGPSQIIQSADNMRSRLKHDNKPIRYSEYHDSPYVAEQEGEIGRKAIVFEEGNLVVHESETSLLKFLRIHPQNGNVFYEVDHQKMAAEELDWLTLEADAMSFALKADTELLSKAVRIMMESDVDNMTVKEIRRDALILAKRDPEGLLKLKSDPEIEFKDLVVRSVSEKHLGLRNNERDIHYNFPDRKSKLLTVPMDQTWQEALERYLKTDEGVELYKILKKLLED